MKVTVSVDVGPAPDPVALEQMFTWAARLELWMKNLPSPYVAPVVATAAADEEHPKTNGAADPGAAAMEPAADAAQANEKRKRGRPSSKTADAAAAALNGETQPAAAAEAAQPSNGGAMPPGMSVALPPGVSMQQSTAAQPTVQPIQPAMPKVEPAADGDAVSYDDLRACYVQVNAKNPKIAFKIMHGDTWSDGTGKDKWFTLENVPAEQRLRLMSELSAAAI